MPAQLFRKRASRRMTLARLCSLICVAAAVSTSAGAAMLVLVPTVSAVPVHGMVALPRAPEPSAAERAQRGNYWVVWAGLLDPASPRLSAEREVTVVLTGEAAERGTGCQYRMEGGDLLPKTIVAQVGSRVPLENRDGTAHYVYSDELSGLTPLRTAPGRSRELAVPDAPGTWALHDRHYPQVSGHLVAIPDLVACASVTPRGAWRFDDVAAGDYTLKAYRGGQEVHSAPLSIAGNARDVAVDPILLTGN